MERLDIDCVEMNKVIETILKIKQMLKPFENYIFQRQKMQKQLFADVLQNGYSQNIRNTLR